MPLLDLSSQEAVGNRKLNPEGDWGDRSGENRVEPVCRPAFEVPFHLKRDDKIFTIGSCFARNVEQALAERGFTLPMLEIFKRPEFRKTDRSILSNYATPSIYNEIAWAFGEEEYPREELIAEVSPGKFVDLNFTPSLRPDTREVVENRRKAITEAYRSSADCRVIIMTLGLSEVWFDKRTGTYLNVTPRPVMLRNDPDRYRLHVLSYDETIGYLTKAIDLLQKYGGPDQRLILTVSPVPLIVTHRSQDVILANTYSKSLLRVVAEEIAISRSSVSYFPSYESFVLSDRRVAFVDDMMHPQMDLVSLNVGRMIDAYTAFDGTLASLREAISRGGELVAVEKAQSVDRELAQAFFEEHSEWSGRSVAFAKAHARHLLEAGRASDAAKLLAEYEVGDDLEHLTLLAQALLGSGKPEEALSLMRFVPSGKVRVVHLWDNLLAAAIDLDDPAAVTAILARIATSVKFRTPTASLQAARFFRDRGDQQKAIELYEVACRDDAPDSVIVEYANSLMVIGDHEKAQAALSMIEAA